MKKNNQVQLIGHLGKDPEIGTLKSGNTYANVTLATSNGYFDQQKKEWVEMASDWHNIKAYGNEAELLHDYEKGNRVIVFGELKNDRYQDKDGNNRVAHYVKLNSIALYVTPKKQSSAAAPTNDPSQPLPSVVTQPPSDEEVEDLPF
jgi:single-strand DNA-binding protein